MKYVLDILGGLFIAIGVFVIIGGFATSQSGASAIMIFSGLAMIISGIIFIWQSILIESVSNIKKSIVNVEKTLEDLEKSINLNTNRYLEKISDELSNNNKKQD